MSGSACAEEELNCQQAKAAIVSFENSVNRGDYDEGPKYREKIGRLVAKFNADIDKLTREFIDSG